MKDLVNIFTRVLAIVAVCRCICEYKNAVTRSRWSSQEGIPAVAEAETSKKVDVVKYLESCIINISLTNFNAFFIADKRGEYMCVNSNFMFILDITPSYK